MWRQSSLSSSLKVWRERTGLTAAPHHHHHHPRPLNLRLAVQSGLQLWERCGLTVQRLNRTRVDSRCWSLDLPVPGQHSCLSDTPPAPAPGPGMHCLQPHHLELLVSLLRAQNGVPKRFRHSTATLKAKAPSVSPQDPCQRNTAESLFYHVWTYKKRHLLASKNLHAFYNNSASWRSGLLHCFLMWPTWKKEIIFTSKEW